MTDRKVPERKLNIKKWEPPKPPQPVTDKLVPKKKGPDKYIWPNGKLIELNGSLEGFDRQQFVEWAKQYKKQNPSVSFDNEDEWVILWKKTVSAEYANRYHGIGDQL